MTPPPASCPAARCRALVRPVVRVAASAVALAAAFAAAPAASAQSRVGTTAASFLDIGTGARYVASGETGVALADDATALFWNPAGIAHLDGGEAAFQHTAWAAGTRVQYAALALRAGGAGHVGVHAYLFTSGEMDVTTLEFEDGTGEQFSTQDLALGLSYARRLTDNFALGGTAKMVHSRVFRMSASTLAADIGAQYQTPFEGVTLGFGIFNFGGEMQLAGDNTTVRVDPDPNTTGDNDGLLANLRVQSWDLPLAFRIGLAYDAVRLPQARLRVTTDARFPNNNNQSLNVGAEVTLLDVLHLRAGASNLFLDDTFGQGWLRLGAGVQLADRLRADYAYADRGDLGAVSTLGASVRF